MSWNIIMIKLILLRELWLWPWSLKGEEFCAIISQWSFVIADNVRKTSPEASLLYNFDAAESRCLSCDHIIVYHGRIMIYQLGECKSPHALWLVIGRLVDAVQTQVKTWSPRDQNTCQVMYSCTSLTFGRLPKLKQSLWIGNLYRTQLTQESRSKTGRSSDKFAQSSVLVLSCTSMQLPNIVSEWQVNGRVQGSKQPHQAKYRDESMLEFATCHYMLKVRQVTLTQSRSHTRWTSEEKAGQPS